MNFPAGNGSSMFKLWSTRVGPSPLSRGTWLAHDLAQSARVQCASKCTSVNSSRQRLKHLSKRVNIIKASSCLQGRLCEASRIKFHTSCRTLNGGEQNNSRLQDSKDQQKKHPASPSSTQPLAGHSDATRPKIEDIAVNLQSPIPSLTRHENIYNIPNILTASRLVAAPVIGYLVLHEQHKFALALFAYAGITDLIDGWMARRFNLQTVVGSVVDPMADKVLMTVLTVTLAVNGLLPTYLATLILGRDVALAVAALYYRYASLPAPKTFQRYWDFSLPSAEVHPTTMSKANTFLQLLLIGSTLAYPVLTADSHHLGVLYDLGLQKTSLDTMMTGFQWLVAGTTVWSGMSYSYLKNAVKILGTDEKLKAKQGRRGRAIIGVTFGSIVAAAAWLALKPEGEVEESVK